MGVQVCETMAQKLGFLPGLYPSLQIDGSGSYRADAHSVRGEGLHPRKRKELFLCPWIHLYPEVGEFDSAGSHSPNCGPHA